MLTIDNFKKTFETIVKGSDNDVEKLLTKYEEHLKANMWPLGLSKDMIINGLQLLIDSKLSAKEETLHFLLTYETRKLPELSAKKIDLVRKLQLLINGAKTVVCEHKDLVIAPFLHGGVFTPILARPELICLDCGMNVTLTPLKPRTKNPSKKYEEIYGLAIIDKDGVKKLFNWCGLGEYGTGSSILRNVGFSDDITKDPKGCYEKSENKWPDPIPFKIVDKQKLESLSGR